LSAFETCNTTVRLVSDPELSPLDLAIALNGNIVVSSEHPFEAENAVTTVREYDARDGHLVRVFSPNGKAAFRKPRGLRFSSSGLLYCAARDEVVSFDSMTGKCLGPVAQLPRLNGQALVLFPDRNSHSKSAVTKRNVQTAEHVGSSLNYSPNVGIWEVIVTRSMKIMRVQFHRTINQRGTARRKCTQ
jgi:hypothetical protein